MKKLVSLLMTAVLALCAVLPAMAESHPLMYRVTDTEGHTIYLLGTMHMVFADTFPIAGLEDVMDKVDTVYFEVSEAEMAMLSDPAAVQAASAAQEPELVENNGLSEETLDLVEQFFKGCGYQTVNREVLRQLPVAYIAQMIQTFLMAGVASELAPVGVDVYTFGMAKEKGLKILGVESIENQLSLAENDSLAYMTEGKEGAEAAAAAEANLVRMLGEADEFPVQLRTLITAYANGDKDLLLTCLTAEGARSESDAARNALFTDAALQALKDGGNALFAIGAYHIISEDGLVNTLTAAGCTVELIR